MFMKKIVETDSDFICDLPAPCFQALKSEEVELIRASKTQIQFRKGDNLTKQGTFASYILFVFKGLATQYVESDDNRSFNLRIIKPGEFIGLSSLFSNKTFNYSSVALTDAHVFLIEKDAILRIVGQNGIFGLGLIQRYSEQNINLFDTLRTVMYKQMNGRLAHTLLYIEACKTEYPDIFQLLTRKDLADFAGISMESGVKLLKLWEKEGVLKLSGKDISIVNRASLEEISKRG
jgi:CRP-like cAMP-binding protein